MKKDKEKKSGLSESFVIGLVALVFLLTGYQTAIFIHRAAVTTIAANRDEPDTVYVYREVMSPPQALEQGHSVSKQTVVRKNSIHSARAESVRRNVPYRKIESFCFDPNTVSVEDLCRLGFSLKQAQSIENYRAKGGIFRRKEDFARSYVVADSVYRRLEPFIDIPLLDLNVADLSDLDALPGIGEWYAQKIIEHRKALGGYSCKEQLMDIYRFDKDKYDALSDLVTVRYPYVYALWELPADSLMLHPYIRNQETARSIIFFRENNPKKLWTVDNLLLHGILSSKDADRLKRCVQ